MLCVARQTTAAQINSLLDPKNMVRSLSEELIFHDQGV
jgi:hypothetical protein